MDQHGSGATVTNRANVQLRGMPGPVTSWIGELVDAGLVAADPETDARRNVLASPTAGVDPGEIVDVGPLVAAVLGILEAATGPRSTKFGVLLDGEGTVHLRGRRHDLCLGARRTTAGAPVFEVRLAQALPVAVPDRPRPVDGPVTVVEPAAVPALVAGVVEMLAELGDPAGRMADVVAVRGRPGVIDDLMRRTGVELAQLPGEALDPLPGPSAPPAGTMPEQGGETWSIGAAPVLGHLGAAALRGLAELAEQAASVTTTAGGNRNATSAQVRLTPWRSVLLPHVNKVAVPSVVAGLEQMGLATDPADPAWSVVACAGSSGCPAAHTDTQRHGRLLIAALREVAGSSSPEPSGPLRVHLSGCAKRCADPSGQFHVTLVGGPGADVYQVARDAGGRTSNRPAVAGPTPVDPETAIAAVLSAARSRRP